MYIYRRAIAALQKEGLIAPEDRMFVSCGGDTDARQLDSCGIRHALITNVDDRRSDGIGRYDWAHCDAESLPYEDGSFDWGFIHAGLHHCRSPHFALLELLRISRKGVLVVESRDSMLMRAAVRLGFVPQYEIEDVALDKSGKGGLRNSGIPNFIYRWTEREVRKTVESAHPERANDFRFFYGLVLPEERMAMSGAPKRLLYRIASLGAKLAFKLFPKQGNQFAFAVIKSEAMKPWIRQGESGPEFNRGYKLGFDPDKYVKEEVDML